MNEVKLEDVMTEKGITYGVVKPGDHDPDGIPLIKAADIFNGGVVDDIKSRITPEKHSEHIRTELAGGEILLTLVGSPGLCAIAPPKVRGFNVVRAVGVFDVVPGVDPRYVMYSIHSRQAQHYIQNVCNTTVQATLNLGDVKRLPINIPSFDEQKAIAHILGTLDDKIELNRKTNETLEGIAKALFKSWFVDFDPVRAKAEGRPTGLPDQISELFPDSLEESELGDIPSGWNIGEVQDLCEWVSSGGTPARSNKEFWSNGDIPWFKTGELNDGPLLESAEKINELAVNNSACKLWEKGTILFAIYASPTVGRLGVLTSRGTSNQAAAGLKASKSIGTPFLRRCLLFSRDDLQNIAVGAAQQNINVKILKEHKVVIPPETLAGRFSALISDFDDRQEILLKEVSSLEKLRNALLPRLISGELRVPDAEKMLEEAGV